MSKAAPDLPCVPTLLATQISSQSTSPTPPKVTDLADAFSEITIRTQILGSSYLTITLIDPAYYLINHGFLNLSPSGLLDDIKINFPVGSDSHWDLVMAEITTDQTGPNITLTFEDSIVYSMRKYWTPISQTTTVLKWIARLVDEVEPKIDFVCPSLGRN